MSQVAAIVDIPYYPAVANLPSFVKQAEEFARLVAKDLPVSDGIKLNRVITGAGDIFALRAGAKIVVGAAAGNVSVAGILTTSTLIGVYILSFDPTPTVGNVAGGAAGNHTVTGVAATSELKSVVTVADVGQAVADLTAEFTATAANTINNTGGTDTTAKRLVVTWHAADAFTMTDVKHEFTITADGTITNTGGTSSANKQLLVVWHD